MAMMAWVILGILALFVVGLVLGAEKLERRTERWEWMHPPQEEDQDEEEEADA